MRRTSCFAVVALAAAVLAPAALAWGPSAGSDPTSNFEVGAMPYSCATEPDGAVCVNAAVYYLDQARASLGQPPYALPADFPSLTSEQQTFVLSNLDRVLYGLPPVPGLVDELDQDSAVGVQQDDDPPFPPDPNVLGFTANWAGAFPNLPLAYEAWMYDDGPGSNNIDCTPADPSGCWGHRHDILWEFDAGDVLGMGAATGTDPTGAVGYAMVIAEGMAPFGSAYDYTWSQAVADGAGTNTYDPGLPQIPVSVLVTTKGPGTVSDGSSQSCARATCEIDETQGVAAAFVARPDPGATFTGWSGACSGTGTCSITPTGATTKLTAVFTAPDCVVPRVKGRPLAAAESAIRHAHCSTGSVERTYSPVAKGRVVSERPAPGRHLANGARVSLVVSRGSRKR